MMPNGFSVAKIDKTVAPPALWLKDDGLKMTVLVSTDSPIEHSSVAPVLRWKDYTIWAYSFIDNSNAFQIIMFDGGKNIVKQWYKVGARYLVDISMDKSAENIISFIGQGGNSVDLTLEEVLEAEASFEE